jgi:hypothetical protein
VPHRRKIITLLSLFLFALGASTSLRTSPPIGAVVQTWHYDAATKQLMVRIANTSNKDITAYNMSVTVKYADGTQNPSETMEDFVSFMATVSQNGQLQPGYGNGTFAAGTSRDKVSSETKTVVDVSAVVDVVVYADRTADVQNQRAFANILALRKGQVLGMQKSNEVIQQALANPNPSESAATELERQVTVLNARRNLAPNDPQAYTKLTFKYVARELRQAPKASAALNQTEGDYLKAMVARHEEHIAAITPHTQVVVNGAGQ